LEVNIPADLSSLVRRGWPVRRQALVVHSMTAIWLGWYLAAMLRARVANPPEVIAEVGLTREARLKRARRVWRRGRWRCPWIRGNRCV
jgi:hypothetical protein